MTGEKEKKRLQSSIAWNNTMMIEAAWKDKHALEAHYRAEMERLQSALSKLDSPTWLSTNFQDEVEGVPV